MSDERPTHVVVFGAGAVGGYFGGRLAAAGHHVTFIARGAHLDAIRRDGLQVLSPKGDFTVSPATATDDTASVGVADVVLVGVKAGAVSAIAPALTPLVGPHTVVVPLQNGVEAASALAAVLPPEGVIGGLCRVAASVTGPGQITHVGIEPTVVVGARNDSQGQAVERVRHLLARAGVTVEVADDIQAALWEKFLLVEPWGGLGGVARVTLDVLCRTPGTRRLLTAAMTEVALLAAAHGVRLADDVVHRTLTFLDAVPEGATASMQRDLTERRPSELDAQTGAILRLGREKGIQTPVHAFLYDCLSPGERLARGAE